MAVNEEKQTTVNCKKKTTLQTIKKVKETETKKDYLISYEKRKKIWYQINPQKDEMGVTQKQILVLKLLREKVIEIKRRNFTF